MNNKLIHASFLLVVLLFSTAAAPAHARDENTSADAGALGREALAVLTEYLRIDTTNPPGNEIRAAEFFKAIFEREGIESRILESAPGRGNVYARLKGDGSKKAV